MKLKITAFITLAMSLAMTGTVFAGTWENGSGENSQRWKYNYEMELMHRIAGSGLTVIMTE